MLTNFLYMKCEIKWLSITTWMITETCKFKIYSSKLSKINIKIYFLMLLRYKASKTFSSLLSFLYFVWQLFHLESGHDVSSHLLWSHFNRTEFEAGCTWIFKVSKLFLVIVLFTLNLNFQIVFKLSPTLRMDVMSLRISCQTASRTETCTLLLVWGKIHMRLQKDAVERWRAW